MGTEQTTRSQLFVFPSGNNTSILFLYLYSSFSSAILNCLQTLQLYKLAVVITHIRHFAPYRSSFFSRRIYITKSPSLSWFLAVFASCFNFCDAKNFRQSFLCGLVKKISIKLAFLPTLLFCKQTACALWFSHSLLSHFCFSVTTAHL